MPLVIRAVAHLVLVRPGMRFSAVLPKTKSPYVRIAVIITCATFWSVAGAVFYHGARPIALIIAAAFVVIAIYLWRLKAWARKASTFCIATSVFLFLCGWIFNPFFLMDYRAEHGVEFDLWRWTLISLLPLAAAVWCYWVLSRRKDEFDPKA